MSRNVSRTFMEVPTAWGEKYESEFPEFAKMVASASRWNRDAQKFEIPLDTPDEVISQIAQIAEKEKARGITRTLKAITSASKGDDTKIPNLHAGAQIIAAFIKNNAPDCWLYHRVTTQGLDDVYLPFVVTRVELARADGYGEDQVVISGSVINLNADKRSRGGNGNSTEQVSIHLGASEVTNKTVTEILSSKGYYVGDDEMRAEYDSIIDDYREIVATGFSEQYTSKRSFLTEEGRSYNNLLRDNGKYIVDLENEVVADFDKAQIENVKGKTVGVPIRPSLRVFDLTAHAFYDTLSMGMERYKYNPGLRDSLVLPEAHKDLLDVLTTDLDVFKSDLIEGKSAGNVILSKGVPGVGKTLTAEVYSEIVERPLYAVHSGELGTDADKIRERLETVFKRAKRWNVVLLLDEADVFVRVRGNDIVHNAIVAEFLRTLEYFDGLLFMTTNRDDIIDEAIVSRCAAMISYGIPEESDSKKIWRVLADTLGVELSKGMEDDLYRHLPSASPRDIKMVIRLAARMAKHHDETLAVDHFRQASTFRGVKWES